MDRRVEAVRTTDPLEQLRRRRCAGFADPGEAATLFQRLGKQLQRQRDRQAWAVEAFLERCPRELADRVAAISLRGGTLTIAPRDAASRYELDRWLRGGGEQEVVTASRGPLQRVRLTAAAGAAAVGL